MKTAFITGSSRGIGKAIALTLAKEGYKIILHGKTEGEKIVNLKKEIENMGGIAEIVTANLCNLDETNAVIEKISNIDILILNASLQYRTPLKEITIKEASEQLNCNFVSSLILARAVIPYMQKQGFGRIITIGSVQEAKPHPEMMVYSASKAAQTNMMLSLSLQLAKDGITVNNIAPGVINTDRNKAAISDPVYSKKVEASIPMGFYGEPCDCAEIVAFLCSDKARYITGQNIFVDGGKGL